MSDSLTQKRLSFREKAGYSLGDMAANLVFQLLMSFQFVFFSEILGLSSAAAGTLFLIGRFFDAFTDPAMGIIADRTRTRWGRFRPWLVWSALPFAAIFWLTFTDPGWEPTMQMVYAYVMYFLLMAVYTVNNVPYCALNGVMTADIDERTTLSSYRFVAVTIAQMIVQVFTWPLVAKLGAGDDARGWSLTIGIFAIFTVILFVISFFSVRERVEPDPEQETSAWQDVKDTFRNRPWVVLFCATLMIFIMLVVRGGSIALYMERIVDPAAMDAFLGGLGLVTPASGDLNFFQWVLDGFGLLINVERTNAPNVTFAFFNFMGIPSTLIGVVLSKPLSKAFGKRGVFVTCMILTALSTASLFFIPRDNVTLMFIQALSWGLAYGPTIPLLWSMIGDAADYSEWKTGRRATGFVFAGVVFALKFGLGVGGFVQGMILAGYGYDEGTAIDTMARSVEETVLPEGEKAELLERVGQLGAAVQTGDLRARELNKVRDALEDASLGSALMVSGLGTGYVSVSSLEEGEIAEAYGLVNRLARGVASGAIGEEALETALAPLARETESEDAPFELRTRATDEQLRAFLANARALADEAQLPAEGPAVDFADEWNALLATVLDDAVEAEAGTSIAEMRAEALLGVRLVTTIYPALFILAAAVILFLYPISRELNEQIAAELEERRKHFKRSPETAG